LTVMARLKTHPVLHAIIFGEGVLCNAMSVVLFRTILELYVQAENANGAFIAGTIVLNVVASPCIGIAIGLAGSYIVKISHLKKRPMIELMVPLLLGFFTFMLAEVFHMPGDVSIFFFGVTARHYLWYNLSSVAREHTDLLYGTLRELIEMLVFLLLGAQLFAFNLQDYNWYLIGSSLAACLIARAVHVFPLAAFVNCGRQPENKFTRPMQIMMWSASLRGAIAYSLAMTIAYELQKLIAEHLASLHRSNGPVGNGNLTDFNGTLYNSTLAVPISKNGTSPLFRPYEFVVSGRGFTSDFRQTITTTHTVIIMTLLLFGVATAPLLQFLKLAGDNVDSTMTTLKTVYLRRKKLETGWLKLDRKYFIPFFSTVENRKQKLDEPPRFRRNTELPPNTNKINDGSTGVFWADSTENSRQSETTSEYMQLEAT